LSAFFGAQVLETLMADNDFSKKMIDILNYGSLNLAMAIGYRTGLFDAMDGFDEPQDVEAIAQKSGLNRRYVKEWLGVMATGGVVEVAADEDDRSRYRLPKAHADVLTRRSGNANLGVYTQEIPLLTTCAMEAVLEGFHSGQGVAYENYPRFQAFMSELANAKHRQVLVEKFLPWVADGRILKNLQSGIRVCDLGCGEGLATVLMARAYPASRFTGIDISADALDTARQGAEAGHLKNVEFVMLDAADEQTHRQYAAAFDYVTAFDAIHDQSRPLAALKGVHAMLKPGGLFSMIDIAAESRVAGNLDHPMGPFLYTVSLMHCMPVGLVNGGTGLGMMWGRQKAVEMLGEAGFVQVDVQQIPEDPFNLHYLCEK
jgi:SAM-dependent methyltransferase